MAWSKRYIALGALEELGMASYQYDITPGEMVSAVRRLDQMMAQWDGMGIRIGYNLPSGDEGSDPDQESGMPDTVLEAAMLNLAVKLAPSYGKVLALDTRLAAHKAYQALLTLNKAELELQNPSDLPQGAGNYDFYRPFFPQPVDVIDVGNDDVLEI